LLDELEKRERELDGISEELLAADGRGLDARLQDIEEFVQKRLKDIHALLMTDVARAKAELSKHCTEITLTPEGSSFRISGDWNLLGGRRVVRGEGGGPNVCPFSSRGWRPPDGRLRRATKAPMQRLTRLCGFSAEGYFTNPIWKSLVKLRQIDRFGIGVFLQ
jgi:hypothetical protein